MAKQNEKLMGNIKTMNKVSAQDECFKIIDAIWSCKNSEQKKGCENMLNTYIKNHGDENIGITFIQVELKRLEKIIEMSELRNAAMKKTQDQLAKNMSENATQDIENMPEPTQEQLKKAVKSGNIQVLKN